MDDDLVMLDSSQDDNNMVVLNPKDENIWTPEMELSLAEKIRSFPALYDNAHEEWKNRAHRAEIWELIANEMELTVDQCRKKYKGLRDKAVREHRLGKPSKWAAAEAMNFVIPVARIRDNPRKPLKNFDDTFANASNDFVFTNSFEDDEEDDLEVLEDVETYDPRSSSSLITPPGSIRANVPTIVSARSISNSQHNLTNKRKMYEVDDYEDSYDSEMSGNYYYNNHQVVQNVRLPPGPKSVMMNRMQTMQNNHTVSNNNGIQKYTSNNHNHARNGGSMNGGSSNRRTSNTTQKESHGPNFYFGQYIATALESLPQSAVIEARQKIQDVLFKIQLKHTVNKVDAEGGTPGNPHHVVVFNEKTGKEQVLEIEKECSEVSD